MPIETRRRVGRDQVGQRAAALRNAPPRSPARSGTAAIRPNPQETTDACPPPCPAPLAAAVFPPAIPPLRLASQTAARPVQGNQGCGPRLAMTRPRPARLGPTASGGAILKSVAARIHGAETHARRAEMRENLNRGVLVGSRPCLLHRRADLRVRGSQRGRFRGGADRHADAGLYPAGINRGGRNYRTDGDHIGSPDKPPMASGRLAALRGHDVLFSDRHRARFLLRQYA